MSSTSKRLLVAALVALGCSQEPVVVPSRNLERPSDMTFLCVEVATQIKPPVLSGRPIGECHNPNTVDRNPLADNPRVFGTFGLVPNTARGELAVVDVNRARLVDLDPAVPGYNMVPVGSFPDNMAASPDGCMALTANRGSCDLTAVDPQRLLSGVFGAPASTGPGSVTTRMIPTTASGQMLRAAPQEVAFLPLPLDGLNKQTNSDHLCSLDGAYYGGDTVVPRRAVVTFPGCDLVALVDVPSGKIVSSVYIREDGAHDAGAEPVCPVECVGSTAPAAGAASLRVGALAIVPDGHRAYVGAASAPFVTALDLKIDALVIPPQNGRITLHENPGGVSRLRLTVDPYAEWTGKFVGTNMGLNRGRFLYAIAGDGSVRVVDVTHADAGQLNERECDVNVDPLFLSDNQKTQGCFPFDDPAAPLPPRRALAQGPGIRVPLVFNPDLAPPVPRDIAFASLRKPAADLQRDQGEDYIDGAFGFLLTSNGSVYVINIEPTKDLGDLPMMTHSFRNYSLGPRGRGLGLPRVNAAPARNFTLTDVPLPVRVPVQPGRGPRLEGIPAGPMYNPNAVEGQELPTWVFFPDTTAAVPQTWAITWEGALSGTDRLSGELIAPGPGVDTQAGILDDLGADFCQSGALPKDVVLFPGCVQDSDCRAQLNTVCRQSRPGTPGLCMTTAQARDEDLFTLCSPLLGSRRRYEVVRSSVTRLELQLKPDELPRTSLNRCTEDTQCESVPGFTGFKCREVRPGEPKRCVKPCATAEGAEDSKLCRVGTVCATIAGSAAGPLCVEGPPLTPACWPGFAPYKVQAGQSFVIAGSSTARPNVARRDATGMCVPDTTRHPFLVNRIPLDTPHCTNVADGEPDPKAPAIRLPMPNPCLFIAGNSDEPGAPGEHVKALFENQAIRFVLTNVDEYVGDAVAMRFDVSGGFLPDTASFQDDVILTAPVRIVTGPNEAPESPSWTSMENGTLSFPYFYVVDQGRPSSSSTAGRGQVLRLNPRSAATLGLPHFDSTYSSRPFQIQ